MSQVTFQQAIDLALEHHQAGRLDTAELMYDAILSQVPAAAEVMQLLGLLYIQKGEMVKAVELIEKAIATAGPRPAWSSNIAEAYRVLGKLDRAVEHCRTALTMDASYAPAHGNLGLCLAAMGQHREAEESFRKALQIEPDMAEVAANLGTALSSQGRHQEAIEQLQRTIQRHPMHAAAHNNLGAALEKVDDLEGAEAAFRKAIEVQSNLAAGYYNLGATLQAQGRLKDAVSSWQRALMCSGDYAEPQWKLAQAALALGDYERGWGQFEWRWRSPGNTATRRSYPGKPTWDGLPLNGKTILLYAEQGLGDTIQFARFIANAAALGGRVLLDVDPSLAGLMKTVDGVAETVSGADVVVPFDTYHPLLSLPRVLGITLQNLPARVPYVSADPARVLAWQERVNADEGVTSKPLRVGIAWAGRSTHANDRLRSMSLSNLAPLAGCANVRFYSLQKNDEKREPSTAPAEIPLIDYTAELTDFSETAALIQNLDLVISVDTAVAHLAGALGKPTWILLSLAADWRWLLDREDSPWYPTARLLRQTVRNDWSGVVERVREHLETAAASGGR